jgi:hypothetical protein
MASENKPLVEVKPGDPITAGRWNDMQKALRQEHIAHAHTGAWKDGLFDGAPLTDAGLANGAVSNPKLADNAVTGAKVDPSSDLRIRKLTVSGQDLAVDASALEVTGPLKINGAAILTNLKVSGASEHTSLAVSGMANLANLKVSGASEHATLSVGGTASLGALKVSGPSEHTNLSVGGTASLGALKVSGPSEHTNLSVGGTATVANLKVSGPSEHTNLSVGGTATVANLKVGGTSEHKSLVVGANTTTDTLKCLGAAEIKQLTVANSLMLMGRTAVVAEGVLPRIVWGTISGDADIYAGSGFTVRRDGNRFLITFNTPFTSLPCVVTQQMGDGDTRDNTLVKMVDTGKMYVYTGDSSGNKGHRPFSFLAIGLG